MAFDINSFIFDHVERGVGFNADGSVRWLANQIENASLQCDGEEVLKKDAKGSTIYSKAQAKTCEFNWESSVADLNLIAEMNGTTKQVASDSAPIVAPIFDTIDVTSDSMTEITLANSVYNSGTTSTPVYKVSVSLLTTDGSLKKTLKKGDATAIGTFTYTSSTKKLTFASGELAKGDTVFVTYEYETDSAVQLVNSAEDMPTATKSVYLVEGRDICDQNTKLYAYLIFPNAKMSTGYTLGLDVDSTVPVKQVCSYDYCSKNKELYRLVIPQTA